MFEVVLYCILQLCAMSFASVPNTSDSQTAGPDHIGALLGTNLLGGASDGPLGYTVLLQQDVPDDQNGTIQSHCIGLVIDSETVVTSQACKLAVSDEKSNSSLKIVDITKSPFGMPLSTQVLQVKPPMNLGPNFVRPTLIDTIEGYEKFKNEDRFGIVIAMQGPKMGLVRWYDQMKTQNEGEHSVCEENYLKLQQKNPEWPEFLPKGIFCITAGRPNEDRYTIVVKGENVTIEAGLPCNDSTGSPIIIPNEGLLGVVTAAQCESDPQVTYAQSLAYVPNIRDHTRNQTTQGPNGTGITTLYTKLGKPLAFYPMPSQYLASPFIKVVDPTPDSAKQTSDFKLTWKIAVLLVLGY